MISLAQAQAQEHSASITARAASVALWVINLAFLVPYMTMATILFRIFPSHKIDFVSKIYCRTQMALTCNSWRAEVHPDVNPKGVYIFAQNHTNHFDHVAMYNATPHFKQGLELEEHFKFPFYGWFMKARGTIPVPAGDSRSSLKKLLGLMRREVDRGNSILAFPEGTRTLDGRVGEFKDGVFYLAIKLGVPIVPVAVTGMYDVMHKGSLMIRGGNQVTVHVGQPIPTDGLTVRDVPALRVKTHEYVAQRVDAYFERRAT